MKVVSGYEKNTVHESIFVFTAIELLPTHLRVGCLECWDVDRGMVIPLKRIPLIVVPLAFDVSMPVYFPMYVAFGPFMDRPLPDNDVPVMDPFGMEDGGVKNGTSS